MELLSGLAELLSHIEGYVVDLGASPWLLLAVAVLSCIDGFFPPVPSESIVIAGASLAVTGDAAWYFLPALALAAAAGAFCGDLIAYRIGARVPVERLPGFRGRRGRIVLERTRLALRRNGTTFVMAGRFIPVGRVAVNLTAGAVGFPFARFRIVAAAASLLWGCLSVALGLAAGHVLGHSPLLAMVVGIVVGALAGFGVDRLISAVGGRLSRMRTHVPGDHLPLD
ncbi:DedA family protein [Brevibacterium album]|uniref:DedA family protein n=1 Tax=Brevibacterium album TaxID=417948 RepID=UPI0004005BFA|nr:VTT domain-containing protein [Brevibacterium album]